MKIPLAKPDITGSEIKAVLGVLETNILSIGPQLDKFEKEFAKYIGVKHAVGVNSGTSALHLAVRALEICDGDEVITTPFSFVASANCALFERAKPVFIDIREDTLNLDETKIEQAITKKTKAILPVHVFGYPADMEKISKIATKHKLKVIEDSCEAIGAEIDGEKVGTWSDCATFAFYPNKQMTTGEGGMLVTDNHNIANLARSMRNQGRDNAGWLAHNRLGYNYRLSEMNCALGVVQLKRLKQMLDKRARVAKEYSHALKDIDGLILPPADKNGVIRSWFVYVIRLDQKLRSKRDRLLAMLRKDGIGCNVYFPAIHLQPLYKEKFGYKKGDFSITERVSSSTIALPFFNSLSQKEIKYVAKSLKKNIKKLQNGR